MPTKNLLCDSQRLHWLLLPQFVPIYTNGIIYFLYMFPFLWYFSTLPHSVCATGININTCISTYYIHMCTN